MAKNTAGALIARSAQSTVASMFLDRVRWSPNAPALEDASQSLSYAELNERVNRIANLLLGLGVSRGDRVALLAENNIEYLQCMLGAAKIGAILACQNWRLAATELQHCMTLVDPVLLLCSSDYMKLAKELQLDDIPIIAFGEEFDGHIANASTDEPNSPTEPEDPLLIIYTSGTTGLPKGAVLSHRAEVIRNIVVRAEFSIASRDTYVAWTPLFHMGAMELSIGTLITGGKVIVLGGFDPEGIASIVAREKLGWLIVMPGTVDRIAAALKEKSVVPVGVRVCGAMADLVPGHEIADITRLLDAPYANTFGATETGSPPCSSSLLPIGKIPTNLSKQQSRFCEIRLVDADDNDVAQGVPGELLMRGPTLFSGYWNADEVNAKDFRGGWFHMGDVLVRNKDGSLDFVDRVKYMIKSGGENIYPAEIERVLLADPRVAEAAVVRAKDKKWGETPIAFVAKKDAGLTSEQLMTVCQKNLAGFKRPKEIRFIGFEEFPRSASGKVQRHELEKQLDQ